MISVRDITVRLSRGELGLRYSLDMTWQARTVLAEKPVYLG
jgi:hypothetical protein